MIASQIHYGLLTCSRRDQNYLSQGHVYRYKDIDHFSKGPSTSLEELLYFERYTGSNQYGKWLPNVTGDDDGEDAVGPIEGVVVGLLSNRISELRNTALVPSPS